MRPEMAGNLRRCKLKADIAYYNASRYRSKKWKAVYTRWKAKLFKQLNKPGNKSNWYWAY